MNSQLHEITSPVTGKKTVQIEKTIPVNDLIDEYERAFNINIRGILKEYDTVYMLRCQESGYRFYYPFDIMGNSSFYADLGKEEGYYLPWKWEHEFTLSFINDDDKLLEVGAAKGGFLSKIGELKNIATVGLELNSEAAREARDKNINVITTSVEEFALTNRGKFDIVCSFQVLEHLSNVRPVLESMITCLKVGGKLIISVPNDAGFIKDNPLPSKVLNMPPHHMGLWDQRSLESLINYFPLKLEDIAFEPLQQIHSDTYQFTRISRLLNSVKLTKVYWKLRLHLIGRFILKGFSHKIQGHSIIAVYIKQ